MRIPVRRADAIGLALAGILVLAHIPWLGAMPRTGEERVTALASKALLRGDLALPHFQVLLTPLASAVATVPAGPRTRALRLPSVLAGAATAWLAFHMASRWGGLLAGISAFLILALAPWETDFGRLATPYPVIRLCLVLATLAAYRACISGERPWRKAAWFACGATLASGSAGGMVVFVLLPAFAIREEGAAGRRRLACLSLAALACVFVLPPLLASDRHCYGGVGLTTAGGRVLQAFDPYFLKELAGWYPRAGIAIVSSVFVLAILGAPRVGPATRTGGAAGSAALWLPAHVFYLASILFAVLLAPGFVRLQRPEIVLYLAYPWIAVLLPVGLWAALDRMRVPRGLGVPVAAAAALVLADGTSPRDTWRALSRTDLAAMPSLYRKLVTRVMTLEDLSIAQFLGANGTGGDLVAATNPLALATEGVRTTHWLRPNHVEGWPASWMDRDPVSGARIAQGAEGLSSLVTEAREAGKTLWVAVTTPPTGEESVFRETAGTYARLGGGSIVFRAPTDPGRAMVFAWGLEGAGGRRWGRFEAEGLPRTSGSPVPDPKASLGTAMRLERGGPTGIALYGPYIRVGQSRCRATLRLRGQGPPGDAAVLVVEPAIDRRPVEGARRVLGREAIPSEYGEIWIDFEPARPGRLEIRIAPTGEWDLWVDWVAISPGSEAPSPPAASGAS